MSARASQVVARYSTTSRERALEYARQFKRDGYFPTIDHDIKSGWFEVWAFPGEVA